MDSITQTKREAVREHGSMLAASEKRLLVWMAQRMPSWVNSDQLTSLSLLAMLAAGGCYWATNRWPAAILFVNLCLVVNWFGDSLDGTLARVRNRQRPRYGYYIDHIVDAFSAVFLFVGMGLSLYMSMPVAMALLLTYLLLAIDSYLATYSLGVFRLSFAAFGPTELRILMIVGNTYAFFMPTAIFLGSRRLFLDVGGGIGAACMAVAVLLSVGRNIVALYRLERL